MIKFLQNLWSRLSTVIFPDDYYSWQTLLYLGVFSFVMSWLARLAAAEGFVDTLIATAGWIFFALGIGWLLETKNVRVFGVPLAPWVMAAIVCTYIFGTVPWGSWELGLTTWPLVSVAIAAIPQFLNWELSPRVPPPTMRQQLILLLLLALLFSNWFTFYFRLQEWFGKYPSLLADDFSRSGFVSRLSAPPEEESRGIALLTATETQITDDLNETPWPYVERWLLNLDEKMEYLERQALQTLDVSEEKALWDLAARARESGNGGYALDLLAIWSGPASSRDGYYLEKTCFIKPRSQVQPRVAEGDVPIPSSTPLATVNCELATPRNPGKPEFT